MRNLYTYVAVLTGWIFFLWTIRSKDLMKILLKTVGLILISFVLSSDSVLASGPRIEQVEESYDFGTVEQGTKVIHDFKFKNKGDADLIITDVKTSCGCTAAVTSAKTIPPGGDGTLKANFNTAGRGGPQTKTITVVTNDPEKPQVLFRLSGKIKKGDEPQIKIDPVNLDMGVIEPGGIGSKEITITNTGTADLILKDFVGRNHVTVKENGGEKRTLKPNDILTIEVAAAPENITGIYQGYLQIRNNSSQRNVTVPVYGYVSEKYMLKPEYRSDKKK